VAALSREEDDGAGGPANGPKGRPAGPVREKSNENCDGLPYIWAEMTMV
jgi:hypothetical protein